MAQNDAPGWASTFAPSPRIHRDCQHLARRACVFRPQINAAANIMRTTKRQIQRNGPTFTTSPQIRGHWQQFAQWRCVLRLQPKKLISPLRWAVFRRAVTTCFIFRTPRVFTGALFSLRKIYRGATPNKSTPFASPENPPFVGRRL